MATCCFDRTPSSDNPSAKPHGRVDGVITLLAFILTLTHTLSASMQAAGLVTVTVLCGAVLLYVNYNYLPYFRQSSNQMQLGLALVFCWACFCLSLLHIRKDAIVMSVCVCVCVLARVHVFWHFKL